MTFRSIVNRYSTRDESVLHCRRYVHAVPVVHEVPDSLLGRELYWAQSLCVWCWQLVYWSFGRTKEQLDARYSIVHRIIDSLQRATISSDTALFTTFCALQQIAIVPTFRSLFCLVAYPAGGFSLLQIITLPFGSIERQLAHMRVRSWFVHRMFNEISVINSRLTFSK